jgi:hypothetical protein
MKLFKLYLEQTIPGPGGEPETADSPEDIGEIDKGRLEAAKKQVEGISTDLQRSLRGMVESLGRLPVMETRTEAREANENMMRSLTEFMESFDEGGANFDLILSSIMAGGK